MIQASVNTAFQVRTRQKVRDKERQYRIAEGGLDMRRKRSIPKALRALQVV